MDDDDDVPAAHDAGAGSAQLLDDIDYALHLARARRRMSQREFAVSLGISKSRLARLEQGKGLEPLALLERLLHASGFRLVLVDTEAEDWDPVYDSWQFRDRGGRRFPAHHVARPRIGSSRWEWVYEPGPDPAFTWGRCDGFWGEVSRRSAGGSS